jgi:hypothetical protein
MRESPIQAAIKSYLQRKGCIVLRQNSGIIQDARSGAWVHLQVAGTPDLLVGIPRGRDFVLGWVEVKRGKGGVLNDDQVRELRKYHAQGVPWVVADSVDDAEQWLGDLSYHGAEKYTKDVVSDKERFVFAKKKPKNAKLSMGDVFQYNLWSKKNQTLK